MAATAQTTATTQEQETSSTTVIINSNTTIPVHQPGITVTQGVPKATLIGTGVFAILLVLILVLIIGIICMVCYRRYKRIYRPDLDRTTSQTYLIERDMLELAVDNLAFDTQEGGGEEDNKTFDLSKLKIPMEGYGTQQTMTTRNVFKPVSPPSSSNDSRINEQQPHIITQQHVISDTLQYNKPIQGLNAEQAASIREYINQSVRVADTEETCPNLDEPHVYSDEHNTTAASCQLSEISHVSSESRDMEFRCLTEWGAPFQGLAVLYEDDVMGGGGNAPGDSFSDIQSSMMAECDDLYSSYTS